MAGDNQNVFRCNYTRTQFLLTLEGIIAGIYTSIYLTLTFLWI